jgi:hypothetical protein
MGRSRWARRRSDLHPHCQMCCGFRGFPRDGCLPAGVSAWMWLKLCTDGTRGQPGRRNTADDGCLLSTSGSIGPDVADTPAGEHWGAARAERRERQIRTTGRHGRALTAAPSAEAIRCEPLTRVSSVAPGSNLTRTSSAAPPTVTPGSNLAGTQGPTDVIGQGRHPRGRPRRGSRRRSHRPAARRRRGPRHRCAEGPSCRHGA